ncbi:carbonic anhydrase [Salininema proteolyticum]|uniref:Carbonic anhydrase n=1 Tax=Salininema proteolyticum TaxID=1607685 RepID=A0ABV8U1Q9_9ACTN
MNASALMAQREVIDTLGGLLEGNERFRAGEPRFKRDIESARRAAPSQNPKAAVFTCVDSRVTAESVFDCDFGQLAVIRTAGHVPDRAAVGSLEFVVSELGVPLIVVLGHERCGAVGAALSAVEEKSHDPRAGYLVEQLWQPAAQALEEAPDEAEPLAMRLQIQRTVADLKRRENLKDAMIVGAAYSLDTGEVTLVDE